MATPSRSAEASVRSPHHSSRRRFLGGSIGALACLGVGVEAVSETPLAAVTASRERVRALLISATTLEGKQSLEHAEDELRGLYAEVSRLLLINFASHPADRDAYAARMRRDFSRIVPHLEFRSLHEAVPARAAEVLRGAEAVFVSGGNTFLLLRELYDREALGVLRERVLAGMPYAGSSAGSNLAGIVIGTTNDFPLVDVPTRRSLGILPGVFNPHHPDPHEEAAYGSRQWKIRDYARFHPDEAIIGVNNAGQVSIRGAQLSLRGSGALAAVQVGAHGEIVTDHDDGGISLAIKRLRAMENA